MLQDIEAFNEITWRSEAYFAATTAKDSRKIGPGRCSFCGDRRKNDKSVPVLFLISDTKRVAVYNDLVAYLW